jgi:hypothetical protein
MKIMKILICASIYLSLSSYCSSQIFVNSLDKIPSDWKGPIFQLSKDYPKTVPNDNDFPWLKFDFRTQPLEYINAVLQYIYEGNIEADWKIQNNKKRKWYHAPSMIWKPNGREFVSGLTRERSSRPFELFNTQVDTVQNWAVGFYNPLGGYILGKVWADSLNPILSEGVFIEGTIGAKLLFTDANINQVPYLKDSYECQAYIYDKNGNKTIKTLKLLQLDIAVKDSRTNLTTGWVFGTFIYNYNHVGKAPWQKMVPVGLSWGNDPNAIVNNLALKETWINPEFVELFTFSDGKVMHTGYKNRLNGPVDNPLSSCISCHSQAQIPAIRNATPNFNDTDDIKKYFRNVRSGEVFEQIGGNSSSVDYSLQLSRGINYVVTHKKSLEVTDNFTEKDSAQTLTTSNDEKISSKNDSVKNKLSSDKPSSRCTACTENIVILTIVVIFLLLVCIIITLKIRSLERKGKKIRAKNMEHLPETKKD